MASLESILNWLRAGYPEGVTPSQVPPLMALLRRALTEDEVAEVVARLRAEHPNAVADRPAIRHAIEEVANTVPTHDEVTAVAARLADTGWPLASDLLANGEEGRLQRILNWLRAGYPAGVPATDYVPLLALLRRQLSNEEAEAIALKMIADARSRGAVPDAITARSAILQATDELPTAEGVQRVEKQLRLHGWPFAENGVH
ncbi:DUF3349 domain-containing protein [Calidifontibacter terrae]